MSPDGIGPVPQTAPQPEGVVQTPALLDAPSVSELVRENVAPSHHRAFLDTDWAEDNFPAAGCFLHPLLIASMFCFPGAARGVSEL